MRTAPSLLALAALSLSVPAALAQTAPPRPASGMSKSESPANVLTSIAAASDAAFFGTRTVEGRLDAGDQTLDSGEYVDLHSVTVAPGAHLRIDLIGDGLDTYLFVRGAATAEDDDGGDGLSARVTTQANAEGGEVRIRATSARAGQTGAYTLRITVQARPFGDAPAPAEPVAGGAATGGRPQVFTGELAAGDQTIASGEFADVHTARVRPGQHVRIDMASPAFDTYLMVSGAIAAQNDDIEQGRTMSRVEGVAGGDGEVRIVATSARAGETGRYLITVSAQDGPFADAMESAPSPTSDDGPVTMLPIPDDVYRLDDGRYTYTVPGPSRQMVVTMPVLRGQRVEGFVNLAENVPMVTLGMDDDDAASSVVTGGAAGRMNAALGVGSARPQFSGPYTASRTGFASATVLADDAGAAAPDYTVIVAPGADGRPAFPLFSPANGLARLRVTMQEGGAAISRTDLSSGPNTYLLPLVIDGLGGCEATVERGDATALCSGPAWAEQAPATALYDRLAAALGRAISGTTVAAPAMSGMQRGTGVELSDGRRFFVIQRRDGTGGAVLHSVAVLVTRTR